MKNKLTRVILACLAISITQFAAMAQPTTTFRSLEPKFGSGYDGDITVNAGTVLDIDVVRAKVTSISIGASYPGTNWPYEYIVTHNNAHGNWGVVLTNQVVMLFQGNQPSCDPGDYLSTQSAHIFAWVSNNNNITKQVTIRTSIPLSNTLIPTTISGSDKVQMIRINNWNNVTFLDNSGFTCNAWDGETGGILAFMVKGTLTFAGDNVTIDASAKGFRAGNRDNSISNNQTAYTAVKGTSTSLDATGGGGTFYASSSNIRRRMDDGAGGCITYTSADEGYGTLMHSPTKAVAPATQTERGCLTNLNVYVNLGSGGFEGNAGPSGASAGGAGGFGAPNGAGTPGTSGTDGTAADPGSSGYGGAGGRGGGVVFVYAFRYDYNSAITTNTIFLANGADAESGDDAIGNGGNAGQGGNGANGNCSGVTYTIAGPGGQAGQAGSGADGGDGGDAGYPGYIRFFANTSVTQPLNASVASALPGIRGIGGKGTFKGSGASDGSDGSNNYGSCLTCYPVNETLNEECNCAKALATIGDAGQDGGTLTAIGTSTIYSSSLAASFDNDLGDWKLNAKWDAGNHWLRVMSWEITQEGIPGATPTAQEIEVNIYNCVLDDLVGTGTNGKYDVFSDLLSDINNSANWDGDFNPNGTSTFGTFEFENDAAPQEGDWLLNSSIRAEAGKCTLNGSGNGNNLPGDEVEDGKDGKGGKGREPSENPGGERGGEEYTNNFNTENVMFQDGVAPLPPFVSIPAMDSVGFKALYPNPTTSEFTLEVGDNDALDVENILIYSTDGKMIQKGTYQVLAHNRLKVIELGTLSKGTYLIQVVTRDKYYSGNFTIQ